MHCFRLRSRHWHTVAQRCTILQQTPVALSFGFKASLRRHRRPLAGVVSLFVGPDLEHSSGSFALLFRSARFSHQDATRRALFRTSDALSLILEQAQSS